MSMQVINGHFYQCFYCGIIVYSVDFKDYYDITSAAKALGISVAEFKELD